MKEVKNTAKMAKKFSGKKAYKIYKIYYPNHRDKASQDKSRPHNLLTHINKYAKIIM